jgi:hypothetical protein
VTIVHAKKAKRRVGIAPRPNKPPPDPEDGSRGEEWVMEQLEQAKEAYELQRKRGR